MTIASHRACATNGFASHRLASPPSSSTVDILSRYGVHRAAYLLGEPSFAATCCNGLPAPRSPLPPPAASARKHNTNGTIWLWCGTVSWRGKACSAVCSLPLVRCAAAHWRLVAPDNERRICAHARLTIVIHGAIDHDNMGILGLFRHSGLALWLGTIDLHLSVLAHRGPPSATAGHRAGISGGWGLQPLIRQGEANDDYWLLGEALSTSRPVTHCRTSCATVALLQNSEFC